MSEATMKKQLSSMVIGLSLAMTVGSVSADGVGPYYATPSWDQQLPASSRFVVLSNWGDQAALDRETGLVWQTNLASNSNGYTGASQACLLSKVGGRGGWRLPTIQELMRTLVSTNGLLIAGSPFSFLGQGTQIIWSTTAELGGYQWVAVTNAQQQASAGTMDISVDQAGAWCVQSPTAGAPIQ